jgi:hypothetical protein
MKTLAFWDKRIQSLSLFFLCCIGLSACSPPTLSEKEYITWAASTEVLHDTQVTGEWKVTARYIPAPLHCLQKHHGGDKGALEACLVDATGFQYFSLQLHKEGLKVGAASLGNVDPLAYFLAFQLEEYLSLKHETAEQSYPCTAFHFEGVRNQSAHLLIAFESPEPTSAMQLQLAKSDVFPKDIVFTFSPQELPKLKR